MQSTFTALFARAEEEAVFSSKSSEHIQLYFKRLKMHWNNNPPYLLKSFIILRLWDFSFPALLNWKQWRPGERKRERWKEEEVHAGKDGCHRALQFIISDHLRVAVRGKCDPVLHLHPPTHPRTMLLCQGRVIPGKNKVEMGEMKERCQGQRRPGQTRHTLSPSAKC